MNPEEATAFRRVINSKTKQWMREALAFGKTYGNLMEVESMAAERVPCLCRHLRLDLFKVNRPRNIELIIRGFLS